MGYSGADKLDGLFHAHYERIARVIGRVIHDQARAEEIAVEVFLKWKRNSVAQGDRAEGWLYRTAVREALDELRRQARRSRFERLFASFRPSPQTPEELHSSNIERQNVREVFAVLSRRQTEIRLLWSEELSYREMAAALEVNPNYVGSLLSRAQDAFRKEYISRYGDEQHG
jgi:RNA polymerase sigma-70 factor (ECF subfamily)